MRTFPLVPTLARLATPSTRCGAALGLAALMAVGGQAAASEIESGDLKIKFGLRLQARLEMPFGVKNAAGDKVELVNGLSEPNDDYQDVDIYFRRIRFGLSGSYKGDTSFSLNFNADRYGRRAPAVDAGEITGYGTNRPALAVHEALIRQRIRQDDITHSVQAGYYQQRFSAAAMDSSGRSLFPNGRPGMGHKNLGLGYQLATPMVTGMIDVQNNSADSREWVISLRAETSLSPDMKMRRTESMMGKEGFGHVLGLDLAHLTSSVDGNDGYTQFGIDYNIHMDGLTGNLDFALRNNDIDDDSNTTEWMLTLQAGYAIPLDDLVVEPALRFIYREQDLDGDIPLATDEGVGQGFQIDAGVNLYFAGHNNKSQIALSHWTADNGDAKKTVFRIQHQLQF